MQQIEGRVAVVTGAASGIGRAMAQTFARAGMRVVLSDVDEPALEQAVAALVASEHEVIGVVTDVAREADVQDLARRAVEAYGAVHVLCNNAGVAGDGDFLSAGGRVWEHQMADWEWTFGVNLWGVVHGLRAFVPLMLEQDDEGHIVNMASMAGLITYPRGEIYATTNAALIRISEALHLQLAEAGSKLRTSVVCPGLVNTRITSSGRNRPAELAGAIEIPTEADLERRAREADERWRSPQGLAPAEVAEQVLEAIRDEQFWVLTRDVPLDKIRERTEQIVEMRNPPLWLV